ncbi:CFEM domain protein [Ceratobasidium sp. AG-Ba]|nr:CFEM domain protein [Ceratobasidium sp. AG-Ba]
MFYRTFPVVLTAFLFYTSAVRADFPPCAQSCIGQADPGSCSMNDNSCLCNNAAYTNPTNDCFSTSCSQSDWQAAYDYAVQLCHDAGVTTGNINNPPSKRSFTPVYLGRRALA